MKKTIRNWIAALMFVATLGGGLVTVATPQPVFACSDHLLTFPAWYRSLLDDSCNVKSPTATGGISRFIWTIALNAIETGLQLVGYISVAFIIVGGFKYMTSAGAPDGMVKARKTILNAVIGLGISIFSVAIVNLVAGAIK